MCYKTFRFVLILVLGLTRALGDEQDRFQELRSRVHDVSFTGPWRSDGTLRRYLYVSNNNVKLAATKLDRTLAWRSEANIDSVLTWEAPEIVKKSLPYSFTGFTYSGNPVLYYPLGKWRLRDLHRAGHTKDVSTYVNQLLEKAFQTTQNLYITKTGESINQVVAIVDLDGFNIRDFFREYYGPFFTHSRLRLLHDDHYPNLVKKWYFIRVPRSFSVLWFLNRWKVPREVRRTIEVYSVGNTRWLDALKREVPEAALPNSLGGSALV